MHWYVFSTNTLYYNNKILSPLNIFFRYCFGQSSIKDIKKNKRLITVWHSIFFKKKMSKITLKQFKNKINKLYKTHNIFIKNKIAFRKIHKDNTSISGFFWFSVKPENFQKSLKSIHKNFSNVIEVKKI